jgi:uncharacterized DUF497 family protein
MEFEWDEDKSDANLAERGFGFDYAALIFEHPTLETVDDRKDYGEVRMRAMGKADDDLLMVIYTDRDEVRRIISARQASRKERRLWQSFGRP